MADVVDVNGNGHAMTGVDLPALRTAEDRELRSLASVLIERFQFLRSAGITFGGKRDLYEVLGYQRVITAKEYRDRYARGGIAKRIVEAFPKATWREGCRLQENESPKADTAFEKAFEGLNTRLGLFAKLQNADTLAGLGYYSVLLLGVADATDFSEPLPRGNPDKLLYLSPFSGGGGPGARAGGFNSRDVGAGSSAAFGDATIQSFDTDARSPRFGSPLTYQLRRIDVTSPDLQRPVHWSRVIHLAEGCLDNEVYGQPSLEPVWNLLDDLDKVTGGGAEAFWLRANQGLHLDVDKELKLSPAELENMREQADDYQHQQRRMLRTRGVSVDTLGSDVAKMNDPTDAILTQIAGTKGIPKRILTGSEMGQLASGQDADNWNTQVADRRSSYAGPFIVRRLVDRLIEFGYLPKPVQYDVVWPVVENLTEDEKAKLALDLANVNKTFGATVFTGDFIREKCYRLEPLPEAKPNDNLTEIDKASLAAKLAMVNKEQGLTVFTPAEIRERCFSLPPLDASEEVPIGAPERISVNQPPPEPGSGGKQVPGTPAALPKAASEAEILRVLEAAIVAGNFDVIEHIIGLEHKYGSTQVQLPPEVAAKLLTFGKTIPDSELADDGRETDAHVTVKYGLLDPDPAKLFQVVARRGPVSLTFGRTSMFAAPDHDVVYVAVNSPDLADLNAGIGIGMACAQSDHGAYAPHATVAYVKPGLGSKYTGLDIGLAGIKISTDKIVMSDSDGNKAEVSLAN